VVVGASDALRVVWGGGEVVVGGGGCRRRVVCRHRWWWVGGDAACRREVLAGGGGCRRCVARLVSWWWGSVTRCVSGDVVGEIAVLASHAFHGCNKVVVAGEVVAGMWVWS
jgi:hypothetical protein